MSHPRIRKLLSLLVSAAFVASLVPASASGASAPPTPVPAGAGKARYAEFTPAGPVGRKVPAQTPRRVNVRWRAGVPAAQRVAAAKTIGFKVVATSKLGWTQVEATAKGLSAKGLEAQLRKTGLVRETQIAVVMQPADATPNDPLFFDQWALENTGQYGGTAGDDIKALDAWESVTGSDIVVAVVDEGVNWAHPDLTDNMWINTDEVPNNGVDDDHNGYVDDVRGYDFYNYDETVYDRGDGDRHGTHVAGIIGAQGDNGVGISGVNWNVRIMSAKFLGPWGGDDFAGAEAIVYAVDNGAKAVNCSWGGQGTSEILEEAIDYAAQKGVLIICAAGNDGANIDSTPFFPASSPATNVITVAATDRNDDLAWFSNVGAEGVDLAAPGVDITSTLPTDPNVFFVNQPPYKLVYLPIQLERTEPAAQRDAVLAASVGKLGVAKDSPVLVVDDSAATDTGDTPGERLAIYTDSLAAAGYTDISTWVNDTDGTPTQADLSGKTIVWFTGRDAFGYYDDECVNAAERLAIGAYLDNGGRMVMASGEMATDLDMWGFDSEWLYTYFGVTCQDIQTWSFTFAGKPQTPFEGLSVTLPDYFNTDDFQWPTGSDAVVSIAESGWWGPEEPPMGGPAAVADPIGLSTLMTVGTYGPLSGTSMAAPHVTGAAALVMSERPSAKASEIKARLLGGVDPVAALEGKVATGGRLNLLGSFGEYVGAPEVLHPRTGDRLFSGVATQVAWVAPEGSDPDAQHEVQFGLPNTGWAEDFESGTMGAFEPLPGYPNFAVTSDPAKVHSGTYASVAESLPGSVMDLEAAVTVTTVTVPAGGATLSFWWKFADEVGDQSIEFWTDDGAIDVYREYPTDGWEHVTCDLSAGEHVLTWAFVNWMFDPSGASYGALDDVTLTTFDWSGAGKSDPGATELTVTPPSADTDDARIRVRATNGAKTSAWTYVKGLGLHTDLTPPAAPSSMNASTLGDGKIGVAWVNPIADFSATRVMRRTDATPTGPNDPLAEVAYEGTGTGFTDGPFADGTRARYVAFARDAAGNYSTGAGANAVAIDVTAPQPVQNLSAMQAEGMVFVTWMLADANPDTKVKVVRRTDTTPTSPGDPNATPLFEGAGGLAVDFMLPASATKAYYSAWAIDGSGNLSAIRSTRLTLDMNPPVGTMAIDSGAAFTGTTTVSVDSSISGASEMRFFTNGEFDSEALWTPYAATSSVKLLPIDGMQSVTAQYRDDAGNILELDDTIYLDLNAPVAPAGLQAKNHNDGVRLTWPKADPSVATYDVYRSSSASGPWTKVANDVAWNVNGLFFSHLPAGVPVYFAIDATDGGGWTSPMSEAVGATPDSGVVRRSGADRVNTAIQVSKAHFTSSSKVVLVSANAPADALGAASYAGVYDAPLLMTGGSGLESEVLAEINRLGAYDVTIVGGTGSVNAAVQSALEGEGFFVDRIAGADRYVVAANVARAVVAARGDYDGEVIVASGEALADPVAAAPIGYSQAIPVLLTKKAGAPSASRSAAASIGVSHALAVGGPSTLPEGSVTAICPNWQRLSGATRYDIAVSVANYAVSKGWATWSFVGVGSGATPADALAGAAACGMQGGVLLLTAPTALSTPTDRALRAHAASIGTAEIYGGTGVISSGVATAIGRAIHAY